METADLASLLEQLVARMGVRLPAARALPVAETFARYEAWQRSRKHPESWLRDESYLRGFLRDAGVKDFGEVTTAQVSEYLAQRATKGLRPKTVNRIREVLHTMFAWFVEQDWIASNPVRRVRRAREHAPIIRTLSVPQLEAMLAAIAHDRIYPLIATIVCAGLRRGEAIWLRKEDLDLDAGMIRIRARADGAWQPKTARNRSVPISTRLRELLASSWTPRADSEWAFPAPSGGRWHGRNLLRRFQVIMRAKGWDWTILDLRHTFATQLVAKNMSLAKVAALMGNSPDICRRHYAHISTEDLRADVDF